MALIAVIAGLAAAVALLFRAGDVQGGRNGDAAPPTPTDVNVTAVSGQLAQVTWTGNDRALGYRVVTYADEKSPTALKAEDVKADVQAYDAKLEEAKPQVCFEVYAVRGELQSKKGDRTCVNLPDESLKPPTDVKVSPEAGGQFRVTWEGREKDAHVILVDRAPAQPKSDVQPGVFTELITVTGDKKQCVTVFAKRGDDVSPESTPPVCVQGVGPTAAPSNGTGNGQGGPVVGGNGQPSESAGTGGGGGQPSVTTGPSAPVSGVVAVIGGPLQKNDNIAQGRVQRLATLGIPAEILPATAVPNHPDGPFPNPETVLVVVRGFADENTAQQQVCQKLPADDPSLSCQVIRTGA
jgi:hypothetical protein